MAGERLALREAGGKREASEQNLRNSELRLFGNFRGGRTESGLKKDNWKPPKEYLKKHACKDKVQSSECHKD